MIPRKRESDKYYVNGICVSQFWEAAEEFRHNGQLFEITDAYELAKGRTPYECTPDPKWSFIDQKRYRTESAKIKKLNEADLKYPIFLGNIRENGELIKIVIDGNHRFQKAIRDNLKVLVIEFTEEETADFAYDDDWDNKPT